MPIGLQTLSNIPFFRGLPEEALNDLLAEGQQRLVTAQTHLFQTHHRPTHLLIVLRGQLQLMDVAEDGRIIGLSFANPGDLVGLLTMIDDQPFVSNVVAARESELIQFPLATARRVILANEVLSERLIKLLVGHIRRSNEERRLLSLPNAFQRVFAQIVNITQDAAASKNGIAPLPKQHDLAIMVNTSRETVSRALQLLIKKGIMTKEGHKIVICRPDALRQLASEGVPIEATDGKANAI
jgi:CRP-like cAMP-binding protein